MIIISIGSSSESHIQNIFFSYVMAYGGGGFAISCPLAKEFEKMQDHCLQRYPGLYGSDDRIRLVPHCLSKNKIVKKEREAWVSTVATI